MLSVLLLSAFASAARDKQSFPYTLDVEVIYAEDVGAESLEEALEERVPFEISRRGCYRDVSGPGGSEADGDLLLLLTLEGLSEETHFEATIEQRAQATDPLTRQQLTAEFEVTVTFQLVLRSERLLIIRSHREVVGKTVRPLLPEHGEDYARREARARAIERIVKVAAETACKGSPKQLEREIEKTLKAAG